MTQKGGGPGRVLIFGGRGYVGQNLQSVFPGAAVSDADIASAEAVAAALAEHSPGVVINCAGKTGRPNIDWCEEHKAETLRANLTGALVVLDECLKRDIYLVHLSSGCIYQGDNAGKGWSEDDPPNYSGSFYSRTKALSDQALRDFPVLLLRMRMPFDGTLSERSLIMKVRKYRRVLMEPNSITYMPDFLGTMKALVARRAVGTYNVVNEGLISPFEIMTLYRDVVDPTHQFEPLPLSQLGEVARAGRSNCQLNTAKLKAEGLQLPPVREAVAKALGQLAPLVAREKQSAGR